MIGTKLRKLPSFPIYQLVAEAHVFSTDCALSHFCSEVHRVRQVRVVLQMFALQGLGLRGLAVELTDVCL